MLSGQLTGSPFVLLFSVLSLSGLWFLNYVELFFFQYKNLEKPYSTNCSMKTLNTYSTYTSEGCADECEAEGIVKLCGCRPVGYKGTFLSFLRLFSINAIVIPAASTRICRIQINWVRPIQLRFMRCPSLRYYSVFCSMKINAHTLRIMYQCIWFDTAEIRRLNRCLTFVA